MSTHLIKEVLKTGECPQCQAQIVSSEDMAHFYCEQIPEHFDLKVTFEGGEKIHATLNGEEVPDEDLKDIDW